MTFLMSQIPEMERLYGIPDILTLTVSADQPEIDRIKRSMKRGRAHDITLYIYKDDGFIFIAKPFYPSGLFRAPSGGVHPGESFVDGAKREALEETGVVIELERYILRINVCFKSDLDLVDWTSHIFTARYLNGEIIPQDTYEISEARLVHPDEIPAFRALMLQSSNAGLRYRAFLTDECQRRIAPAGSAFRPKDES
jgi:8-oxo-dGTP pyrophosphatase MutT (NUDIX family)